jgi:O-antigen/teichoic acid export membrane protein
MGQLNLIRSQIGMVRTALVLGTAAVGIRRLDVLLLAYSAAGLGAAVLFWRRLVAEVGSLRYRPFFFRRALAGEYFRFGSAVQISTLSYQAGDQLFRALLGGRFGAAWMGYYDLAGRAALALRSLASVLLAAMIPFGTEKQLREGEPGVSRLHRLSVKYLALVVMPGTALLLYFSSDVIRVWLGDAPGTGGVLTIFRIFLVGNAIAALGGPAAMIGRSVGRPLPEAAWTVAGVVAGLVSATLVSGFVSAALLYAVGSFGAALVIWLRLRILLGFSAGVLGDLVRVAVASLLTLGVVVLVSAILGGVLPGNGSSATMLRLAVATALGIAVFSTLTWISGVLDRDEREFWRARLRLALRKPSGTE